MYVIIINFAPNTFVTMANERILIAEDEAQNIILIQRMLKKLGHTNLVIVNNGQEVVDIMKDEAFDLLVLDISMPKLNGIEAAKIVKENNGFLSGPIPIVIVSGNSPDYLNNMCRIEKIDFFISKPFRFNDLKSIFTKLGFN